MQYVLMMASDNKVSSGAFQSMSKLCQLIKNSGHYEPIVVLRNKGNGQQLLEQYGIKYCVIRSHSWIVPIEYSWTFINRMKRFVKKVDNVLAVKKLTALIKKRKVVIVHMNTSYTYVGAIAAQKCGVPYIWHLRELLDLDQNNTFWDDDYRVLYENAARLIAISQFVYDHFSEKVNPANMVMIPNGIDVSKYYVPDKKPFSEKCTHILCVGNMNGTKGQEVLIQACAYVKKHTTLQWCVELVGGGTEENRYQEMCKCLGLENEIKFCGIQKNTIPYYRKADIMIMSSKAEAFGRTTVEAMMAGCVIIGSNSGATPELLQNGKYGYLYDRTSPESLGRLLVYVQTHQEEATLVAIAGQKMAKAYYTSERNAVLVQSVYDKILEEK